MVAPLLSKATALDKREVCARVVGLPAATFVDQRVPETPHVSLMATALTCEHRLNALFDSSIGQSSLTCRCSRETLRLGQLGAFGAFLLVSQACESDLAQFSPGGLSGESGVEAASAKP